TMRSATLFLGLALGLAAPACTRDAPAGDAPVAPPARTEAPPPAEPTAADGVRPTERPFLWRLEAPGAAKPSYLYGTIHVPDDQVLALPSAVRQALVASDALYTEVPMDPAMQLRMAPMIMLPEGKTLKDVLPVELYSRLDKLFTQKGLPFAPLSKFKAWAIATQVTLLDHIFEFAAKQPLDMQLYLNAQSLGKQVGGLETLEEQVAVFDGLSTEEQVRMLRETLDMLDEFKRQGRDAIRELVQAYLGGDEDKLLQAVMESYDPTDPLDQKVMKRLLSDRNQRMAERIAARIQAAPDKGMFFAVGAAHLLREDGVGRLLEARGYKLARLPAP
ncbi:MAG TPA: TraB/GumN family protein, partial [Myxococcota bacterium]|nr:TraB/GumN family protein [Myxococcota bacterium]